MVLYYTKVGSTFILSCCFIIEKEEKFISKPKLCVVLFLFLFFSFCFVFVLVVYMRLLEAFHFLFKNIFSSDVHSDICSLKPFLPHCYILYM